MKHLVHCSLLLLIVCSSLQSADSIGKVTRTEDVIYGRKFGVALTFDVFEPAKKNGAAVLFMVSGGFFSSKEAINPGFYNEFLDRGYTVFAIVHGSQPKFQIPEITEDIQRAVRFVRHNASRWGVDTNRFGITGASAGGHLSLTMATQGRAGQADAKDPVDRAASTVQVAACFFPPTDFLNWGAAGDDAVGVGTLANFKPAFGARSGTAESRKELGREISPLNFVTARTAPSLIIHGDADKLVPLYQAEIFGKKCKDAGVPFKLIVKPGAQHGWAGIEKDLVTFADWFDEHLKAGAQK